MPPKKASQVHLVVDKFEATDTVRVVEAYTTEEAAQQAIDAIASDENGGDYSNLGIVSVELKTAVAPPKKAAKGVTKTVSRAPKKVKAEDDDDNDDDANDDKVNQAEKRKQIVEGDAHALTGLKLLFTGTFAIDRKTCEASAVKAGATIASTMKQADIIVLGTKPGPKKVVEIEENGYETWDEAKFFGKIQGSEDAGSKKKKSSN